MHCRTTRRRDEGIKLLDTRTCAVRMRSALVLTIPVAHGSFNLQLPRTLGCGVTMRAASPAPKRRLRAIVSSTSIAAGDGRRWTVRGRQWADRGGHEHGRRLQVEELTLQEVRRAIGESGRRRRGHDGVERMIVAPHCQCPDCGADDPTGVRRCAVVRRMARERPVNWGRLSESVLWSRVRSPFDSFPTRHERILMAHGVEFDHWDDARAVVPWRRWGPYLSERQLGTARENIGNKGGSVLRLANGARTSSPGSLRTDERPVRRLAWWKGADPMSNCMCGLPVPGRHLDVADSAASPGRAREAWR